MNNIIEMQCALHTSEYCVFTRKTSYVVFRRGSDGKLIREDILPMYNALHDEEEEPVYFINKDEVSFVFAIDEVSEDINRCDHPYTSTITNILTGETSYRGVEKVYLSDEEDDFSFEWVEYKEHKGGRHTWSLPIIMTLED